MALYVASRRSSSISGSVAFNNVGQKVVLNGQEKNKPQVKNYSTAFDGDNEETSPDFTVNRTGGLYPSRTDVLTRV